MSADTQQAAALRRIEAETRERAARRYAEGGHTDADLERCRALMAARQAAPQDPAMAARLRGEVAAVFDELARRRAGRTGSRAAAVATMAATQAPLMGGDGTGVGR